MALLGIDLGGTKLATATFDNDGHILFEERVSLENRKGKEVGMLITDQITKILHLSESQGDIVNSIGISVPGISHISDGTVWAPNIPGWDDYPLMKEVKSSVSDIPVTIDSDRACCILGELWKGNAGGCRDAIFMAVGTGIGVGILINGEILRGSNDIAGCIGWMALKAPFEDKYIDCGCFEYHASGEGIARVTRELLNEWKDYKGLLKNKNPQEITSFDVFAAYHEGDPLADKVMDVCVEFWGMAVANLVSLFNPEKIILGGGVFGPGKSLIPRIRKEAAKWSQPISIKRVEIDVSALEGDAGVYGAGFLALSKLKE